VTYNVTLFGCYYSPSYNVIDVWAELIQLWIELVNLWAGLAWAELVVGRVCLGRVDWIPNQPVQCTNPTSFLYQFSIWTRFNNPITGNNSLKTSKNITSQSQYGE